MGKFVIDVVLILVLLKSVIDVVLFMNKLFIIFHIILNFLQIELSITKLSKTGPYLLYILEVRERLYFFQEITAIF